MDRSSVMTLIASTYQTDEIGQSVPVETRRQVFCNLRSVGRAEWAAAGQRGLNPELVATMFAPDYLGEGQAELPVSGIFEAEYLLDMDRRELSDDQTQLLRGSADNVPTNPGSAIRYAVYRTYRASDDTIELYLERKAGVTNG